MRQDLYRVARDKMVDEQIIKKGIKNERVIEMMRRIPRHLFLDNGLGPQAYSDHSFPIGFSQTISKPFIVAYLAEQLELGGRETVLEIGTGSGYQAAILSGIAENVFSIERIPQLATKAKRILKQLEIFNVHIKIGDGAEGFAEAAPFDRILLTAAARNIPRTLIGQLAGEGVFLGPLESSASGQRIVKIRKNGAHLNSFNLGKCAFVPLISKTGKEEKHRI